MARSEPKDRETIWFTTTSGRAMLGRVSKRNPDDPPAVWAMFYETFPHDQPRLMTWDNVKLWSPILIQPPATIREGGAE